MSLTKMEMRGRERRAKEWKEFRAKFLFSQEQLAVALGISRRSVQYVESAAFPPLASTLQKFRILKQKYENSLAQPKK